MDIVKTRVFYDIIKKQIKQGAGQFRKIAVIPEQQKVSVIIRKKQIHINLLKYLHAACLSPVKSTWLKAIKKKNFKSWLGLTEKW